MNSYDVDVMSKVSFHVHKDQVLISSSCIVHLIVVNSWICNY